jgi:hypothetical protein
MIELSIFSHQSSVDSGWVLSKLTTNLRNQAPFDWHGLVGWVRLARPRRFGLPDP